MEKQIKITSSICDQWNSRGDCEKIFGFLHDETITGGASKYAFHDMMKIMRKDDKF